MRYINVRYLLTLLTYLLTYRIYALVTDVVAYVDEMIYRCVILQSRVEMIGLSTGGLARHKGEKSFPLLSTSPGVKV